MLKFVLFSAVFAFLSFPAIAQTVEIDGRIIVETRGAGRDVILLPGLGSSRDVWNSVHLDSQYRLHMVQLNGFAGQLPGANATGPILQPAVEAIHHYMKAHNLPASVVVGHSLGGLIALMLAKTYPEDVQRLVIVDALPFYGILLGGQVATAAAIEPQAAAFRDTVMGQTAETFAASEKRLVPSLAKSPSDQGLILRWATTSDRSVLARSTYEDITTDLRADLSNIKAPTLVLYPWDTSSPYPKNSVDILYQGSYRGLSNATFQCVNDSMHFIPMDQPHVLFDAIENFLK